jgi:hypothetical protein
MLGITANTEIETVFPMVNADSRFTLTFGDVVGFDFNREIHRIQLVEGGTPNVNPRVALKLHYVVYPKAFWLLGRAAAWLTSRQGAAALLG